MWTPLSGTIDWCEENYLITEWIAEFWNTVSSLALSLSGLLLLSLYKDANLPRRVTLCHFFVVLVGLGSVFFHATLSYAGQLADELSMFWLVLIVAIDFCRDGTRPLLNHTKLQLLLIISGLFYTYHMLFMKDLGPWQVLLFQGSFGGCLLWNLSNVYKLVSKNDFAYRQFRLGTISLMTAYILWLTDHFFCEIVQDYQLHAMWHLVSSIGIYYLSQMQIYVALQARGLQKDSCNTFESGEFFSGLVFHRSCWQWHDKKTV